MVADVPNDTPGDEKDSGRDAAANVDDDYHESEDDDYNPESETREDEDSSDDEDGESKKELEAKYKNIEGEGLIKTRSQRQKEEDEGKQYKIAEKHVSTVDADAIWRELNSTPVVSAAPTTQPNKPEAKSVEEEYITIKRTYRFAGKTTVEEKRVLKGSAEAQAWLKEQGGLEFYKKKAVGPRKRKSTLETELAAGKAKKMNTLEKSRLDWLSYVDDAGIKDDLTRHNKGGYLHKQDFLKRVESKIHSDYKEATRNK
jgi:hypothetical protein